MCSTKMVKQVYDPAYFSHISIRSNTYSCFKFDMIQLLLMLLLLMIRMRRGRKRRRRIIIMVRL
jgi:hypothetical protein